jgi:hypothetical protein
VACKCLIRFHDKREVPHPYTHPSTRKPRVPGTSGSGAYLPIRANGGRERVPAQRALADGVRDDASWMFSGSSQTRSLAPECGFSPAILAKC